MRDLNNIINKLDPIDIERTPHRTMAEYTWTSKCTQIDYQMEDFFKFSVLKRMKIVSANVQSGNRNHIVIWPCKV